MNNQYLPGSRGPRLLARWLCRDTPLRQKHISIVSAGYVGERPSHEMQWRVINLIAENSQPFFLHMGLYPRINYCQLYFINSTYKGIRYIYILKTAVRICRPKRQV
jgi:hypothetical protein